MSRPCSTSHRLGITGRMAMLSWLVTIATLVIFLVSIVPQQKDTFLDNLESKARGVSASLQEVTSGAVVTEDYSTVIDHCGEIVKGDKSIDFIVITKNDGFSLISESARPATNAEEGALTGEAQWRSADLDAEWRPSERSVRGSIQTVDPFEREVFRYSRPFDYSGIEWGWIHIGLSLQAYNASVSAVYRRTAILATFCVAFSLLVSAMYARRLVRPIRSLQAVVRELAKGDLSVRADIRSADEIETLGGAFNSMADALSRRDRILGGVRLAAQRFLVVEGWRESMPELLSTIGEAAELSRAYLLARCQDGEGTDREHGMCVRYEHEWAATGVELRKDDPLTPQLICNGPRLPRWLELLRRGEVVKARASDLEPETRQMLGGDLQSMIWLPIRVNGEFYGLLGFEQCVHEHEWSSAEQDCFRATSDMLGAAIERQISRDALIEAKETLENRVRERTAELEQQVRAKERAFAELAEAQQRVAEVSRQAGMAEVATGVLHNVGNVLNSINVSVDLLQDRSTRSKVTSLQKTAALLQQHSAELANYLTADPKGKLIPEFLDKLSHHLTEERAFNLREITSLARNVEHVKEIVAMQQNYARVSGVMEVLPPRQLLEDALQINAAGLTRHGVQVARRYGQVSDVLVDKHKVLQILINLIRNAKYALDTATDSEKRLDLEIGQNGSGNVKIIVRDNGVGIAPENLNKIFSHGFTTKRDGHGFGLHSGALAAKEMGGSLIGASEGLGRGAVFTLELPIAEN